MNKEKELVDFKEQCVTNIEPKTVTQELQLEKLNKELITESLPKKFTQFRRLSTFGSGIFKNEKLIEIQFSNKVYLGKCFIDSDRKGMAWRPQHQWYVFIAELDSAFSFDLLCEKKVKLVATGIEIRNAVEKRIDILAKKGRYHFKEIMETYNKIKQFEGEK